MHLEHAAVYTPFNIYLLSYWNIYLIPLMCKLHVVIPFFSSEKCMSVRPPDNNTTRLAPETSSTDFFYILLEI